MPVITLHTQIAAPVEVVFDLARSIDFHKTSTSHTKEEAIAGKTTGLISLNETVTWRARHFGLWLKLTSGITAFNPPFYFTDEMVSDAFKCFKHEHIFIEGSDMTTMTDVFNYKSPYGYLGKLADALFVRNYMTNLLMIRNTALK